MMVSFMRFSRSRRAHNATILLLSVFLFGLCACSPKNDEKISKITAENVRLIHDSANLALTGDVSVELEMTLIEALKRAFRCSLTQILEYLNSLFSA